MGGRIDCYLDLGESRSHVCMCAIAVTDNCRTASLYSYLGFTYLIKNLEMLEAHDVQVE